MERHCRLLETGIDLRLGQRLADEQVGLALQGVEDDLVVLGLRCSSPLLEILDGLRHILLSLDGLTEVIDRREHRPAHFGTSEDGDQQHGHDSPDGHLQAEREPMGRLRRCGDRRLQPGHRSSQASE
jgi:hypothetical protein